MLTPEQFLLPRYKVIADFPQLIFKFILDEILVKKGIHFVGECKSINEKEIDLYPAVFKKLQWWEERNQEDFGYAKRIKLTEDGLTGETRVGLISSSGKLFVRDEFNGHEKAFVQFSLYEPITELEYFKLKSRII